MCQVMHSHSVPKINLPIRHHGLEQDRCPPTSHRPHPCVGVAVSPGTPQMVLMLVAVIGPALHTDDRASLPSRHR